MKKKTIFIEDYTYLWTTAKQIGRNGRIVYAVIVTEKEL